MNRKAVEEERKQSDGMPLIRALLSGVVAALVCGFLWGLMVKITGYELSIVAIAIGFACGHAVVLGSGRKKGESLQIVAVFTSILGVVLGKFFYYWLIAKVEGGFVSIIGAFFNEFTAYFGAFDVLWTLLAVTAAWAIPKPERVYLDTRKQGGQRKVHVGVKTFGIFIGASMVIAAIGYALFSWYLGTKRIVYFVNGTENNYTVSVNGNQLQMNALSHTALTLREGKVRIKILNEPRVPQEMNYFIITPFWQRPFLNKTYVINPDKSAVLLWEQTEYSKNAPKYADLPYHYYAGRGFYEFEGVDYIFVDFPEEINLPTEDAVIEKERLSLIEETCSYPFMEFIMGKIQEPFKDEFIKRKVLLYPEENYLYSMLAGALGAEETLAFLRKGLSRRPVAVAWHRMYQYLIERLYPEKDLRKEYESYLEAEPHNVRLKYLLGRTVRDIDAAEKLYRESVIGSTPCAYGWNALAFNKLAVGQFDEARTLIEYALNAQPENTVFQSLEWEILLAQEEYEVLLQRTRAEQEKYPYNGMYVSDEIYYLMALGNREAARKRIHEYCSFLGTQMPAADVKEWKNFYFSLYYYLTREIPLYMKVAQYRQTPEDKFVAYFIQRDVISASKTLNSMESADAYYNLLIFQLAQLNGEQSLAQQHLRQAIAFLERGTWEEKTYARLLAGKEKFSFQQILRLAIWPSQKAILLGALGLQFPEYRQECFNLAEKLNYHKVFPHYFLEDVFSSYDLQKEGENRVISGEE